MNYTINTLWPEIMYKRFQKGIASYYKTGLDFVDSDYWSETSFE